MKGVKEYIDKMNVPIVIKADGLASGKGVFICKNKNTALQKCKAINQGKFKSSKKFVIEEFLSGEEASYFILSDGKNYKFFGTVERKFSEVNLANANNGRIVPVETITKYYIFIEELKTTAENREEKLNEIL